MENKTTQSLISAFDIIGPIMVGPSSSHTAGALRISLLARNLLKGELKNIIFKLYGSFARTYEGHGTDKALLAGALGLNTDDLRIKYAKELAAEQQISYKFIPDFTSLTNHPNTVDIVLESSLEKLSVRGISVGGGRAVLTSINNIEVYFDGSYNTIVVPHKDRFGVLSHLVKNLSEAQINIAQLKCYRESRGNRAFAVIEIDDEINADLLKKLADYQDVYDCIYVRKLP